jgi:hypothetical protein
VSTAPWKIGHFPVHKVVELDAALPSGGDESLISIREMSRWSVRVASSNTSVFHPAYRRVEDADGAAAAHFSYLVPCPPTMPPSIPGGACTSERN